MDVLSIRYTRHSIKFFKHKAATLQSSKYRFNRHLLMIHQRSFGFTLIELITTMVIVGILAVTAVPRFFERQSFDARSFSNQAQSMMRYAQKVAVAQNRNVYARLDGTSFAFCYVPFDASGNCASQVPAPTGGNSGSANTLAKCSGSSTWLCEAIPANAIAYAAAPAIQYFYFNALGKPFNLSDTPPNSTFAGLDISLTGGGVTRHVVVEPETGYVHP